MFTWRDNVPHFVAKEFVGDKLTFFFGSTNIDDIEITELGFEIQLLKHSGRWSIQTTWHEWSERARKPDVDGCVSELSKALKAHKDFDFRKYWRYWSHTDKNFAVVIRNTSGDCRKVV